MTRSDLAQEILKIGFGWALGLASPVIWEWQKRRRRVKELRASIVGELRELQYRMCLAAFQIRTNRGNADEEFLKWLDPIVKSYTGAEANQALADGIRDLREALARNPSLQRERRPLVGLALKEFTSPLLSAHLSEISNFPVKFQSEVLTIKGHLDLFNQTVAYLRKQDDRTFDQTITGPNREAVMKNIDNGYVEAANRARRIADAVRDLSR